MLNVNLQTKLRHFDLEVNFSVNNELVVLFGPSGSGKTTILHAIAGLFKPDSGRITLNNKVFFDHKEGSLPPQKRNIGMVFQNYALFPHLDIEKNIYYGVPKKQRSSYQSHINHLLEAFGITHLKNQYPSQLSGGEKQRAAVVRAIANKPRVLLMDEPFSALDEEVRMQGHREIMQLKQAWQIPIILVTHNRQEAEKLADKIIFLKNGKEV